MPSRYAESTSVPIPKSRMDIEELVIKHGAVNFASITRADMSEILFDMAGYTVRFKVAMPDFNDDEFRLTPERRTRREPASHRKIWEQACRQRWRALHLMIRAKIEAIEAGVTTVEDEFLAHLALPSGETVGERMKPQLKEIVATGGFPQLSIGDGS